MRDRGASYAELMAKLGVSTEAVERREWAKVLAADPCAYCGAVAPAGTVDHIVASARDGGDTTENLTGACLACNSGKCATPLLLFLLSEHPPEVRM
jgi:hypothetical protein